MPAPSARTLGQLRRIANAIEVRCAPCEVRETWIVYDLIQKFGASMPVHAVPDRLWIGCKQLKRRGCQAGVVITAPIMLSEMGERFLVRCTGVADGRACKRHKEVVPRWIVRERGDMPVDTFLKSLRCLLCKTKGAELE